MSQSPSVHPESPAPAKPKLSPARRKRRIRRIAKGAGWALLLCALAAAGWWYYDTTQSKDAETDAPQWIETLPV